MSLSRLNHRQPGTQTDPEVMQGTAELHHQIADALLPQAHPVFHNATALDAAVDVLDPEPPLVERKKYEALIFVRSKDRASGYPTKSLPPHCIHARGRG
jgi:hypothetical protein